jgi:hypothetical protein
MTDGFTGLFTQPVNGAKEEGALGAVKGFAKGTAATKFLPPTIAPDFQS